MKYIKKLETIKKTNYDIVTGYNVRFYNVLDSKHILVDGVPYIINEMFYLEETTYSDYELKYSATLIFKVDGVEETYTIEYPLEKQKRGAVRGLRIECLNIKRINEETLIEWGKSNV
jgi:hypothetical protein